MTLRETYIMSHLPFYFSVLLLLLYYNYFISLLYYNTWIMDNYNAIIIIHSLYFPHNTNLIYLHFLIKIHHNKQRMICFNCEVKTIEGPQSEETAFLKTK